MKIKKRYPFFGAGILLITLYIGATFKTRTVTYLEVKERKVESPEDIEMIKDSLVAPILYQNISELASLPPKEKKQKFIDAVLPAILIAKFRIHNDRTKLEQLMHLETWTAEDSLFYDTLANTYKAKSLKGLLVRTKTHPNSIVLAQAAVESGWGASRFFREADNLFGVWSYNPNEPRIVATYTRKDHPVYLRKYDNLSASIRDYFRVIGRGKAHANFREAREQTDNVSALLPELKYYSERRGAYVQQLRTIIRQNNLTQYDHYQIDPRYIHTEKKYSILGFELQ